MNTFWRKLKSLFTVPDTFDPDDLRLRRVCNGVLVVLGFIGLISTVSSYNGVASLRELRLYPDYFQLFLISLMMSLLSVGLFLLNRWRRTPRYLVGWILVLAIMAVIPALDTPQALTNGRSVFAWTIPIILSVIVLPPAAVFVVNILITFLFVYWSGFTSKYFQIYTLCELYMTSFLAWLGMSIAERAIRDARNESQKNRAILNGVADGVIVVGMDNTVALANSVAMELVNGEMPKIISAGERAEIGGRVLSLRWSRVQGVGRVAIIRDISRQIEIEHAKDAVLRVVSHEMRTPLAAILGFTEVLIRSIPNSDMLERIRTNAQRMMTLVNDLLDQAYIEAGVLKMCSEKFSPLSLAKAIQDAFCARATAKQIALSVAVSESLPEVLTGDLHRYQQILTNLVDNAIKFTESGGQVAVFLTPCENADKWQMIVSDTGIGIPPERLPDIFLPFRRSSDYATRSAQGAGLGLSIAKRIAQLARGDIEVQSTVGRGSTFIVTLPVKGDA